jgi:hypothetical protein
LLLSCCRKTGDFSWLHPVPWCGGDGLTVVLL